jgi:RHS repeat-associated protein
MIARVKAVNSQPYYYHHDFRGSTVAITNANQNLTHKYQYGAFGETEQVQEEDFNAYRYVGKYGVGYEAKDLTFMRARYYQPNVGRFNSEDPVWGTNLYQYSNNNSINLIDINGMSARTAVSTNKEKSNRILKNIESLVKKGEEYQSKIVYREKEIISRKSTIDDWEIKRNMYSSFLASVEKRNDYSKDLKVQYKEKFEALIKIADGNIDYQKSFIEELKILNNSDSKMIKKNLENVSLQVNNWQSLFIEDISLYTETINWDVTSLTLFANSR